MNKYYKSFLFLLLVTTLFAAPPAPGLSNNNARKDGVHQTPTLQSLKALGFSQMEIDKIITPPTGTKNVAVVFINFSDSTLSTTALTDSSIAYTGDVDHYVRAGTGLLARMKAYYSEVSNGLLTLNFTVFTNTGSTGFTLTQNTTYYGGSTGADHIEEMFTSAITIAHAKDATLVKASYDSLLVVHAGNGQESTKNYSDVWSLFVPKFDSTYGFTEAETVPATEKGSLSPLGVICHEFGHQLGLPDLYNTSLQKSKVGYWDLMDYGAYLNNGLSPAHFSSWSKKYLGWVAPSVIDKTADLTFTNWESTSGNSYQIPILGSSSEYFLLEYREKTGFDTFLPGEGVLIWHIDETYISATHLAANDVNNGTILGVALEEEDAKQDAATNYGDATDPFKTAAQTFSTPQSDSNTKLASYITVYNFAGAGTTTMTANLFSIPAASTLSISKTLNYPNPVKNATSTTIRAIFSRPFTSATLRIYTLAGELLFERSLDPSSDLAKSASTAANVWIYDYNWDLKNSNGATVASGIYVYAVSAVVNTQRITKTGKLAVIR